MSIGLAVMTAEEEMTSQKRGGAGGNPTDRVRETVVRTGAETETRSPLNKLSGSSTTSGAGKTTSNENKARNTLLESWEKGATIQMPLLLRRRSRTLNCLGRSRKIPTHSGG